MVARFQETETEMSRKSVQLIHEGKYAAEVPIELIEDETGWSPHVAIDDVKKLDRIRLALRRGDVAAASREARVFELLPISA
jgi:hypothetical protein